MLTPERYAQIQQLMEQPQDSPPPDVNSDHSSALNPAPQDRGFFLPTRGTEFNQQNPLEMPASSVPKGDPSQHYLSDYQKLFSSGSGQLVSGLGFVLKAMGAEDFGGSMEEAGARASEYWTAQLSPAMRESMNKKFISSNEEQVFGGAWGDLHSIMGIIVQSAPSMVPGIGAAAKGGSLAGKGAQALGLGRVGTQRAAMTGGAVAGGLTEGGIAGGRPCQKSARTRTDTVVRL